MDAAVQRTMRSRINHSSTVKDGWRHETTVEITGPEPATPAAVNLLALSLEHWEGKLDEIGRRETDRRNAIDRPTG